MQWRNTTLRCPCNRELAQRLFSLCVFSRVEPLWEPWGGPCRMHWVPHGDWRRRCLSFIPFIMDPWIQICWTCQDREHPVAILGCRDWKSEPIHSSFMCLFVYVMNIYRVPENGVGEGVHGWQNENSRTKTNEVPLPSWGTVSSIVQETVMRTPNHKNRRGMGTLDTVTMPQEGSGGPGWVLGLTGCRGSSLEAGSNINPSLLLESFI